MCIRDRYIPIHPFAEELSTLCDLGMKPSDCRSVDAWSHINGDATLLQVYSLGHISNKSKGLYALRTKNELEHCYLIAVVESETITRTIFESVMVQFVESGFPAGPKFTAMSIGESIVLTPPEIAG